MNIGEMAPTALSMAFQVFRDATLKLGDGQYYISLAPVEIIFIKAADKNPPVPHAGSITTSL